MNYEQEMNILQFVSSLNMHSDIWDSWIKLFLKHSADMSSMKEKSSKLDILVTLFYKSNFTFELQNRIIFL